MGSGWTLKELQKFATIRLANQCLSAHRAHWYGARWARSGDEAPADVVQSRVVENRKTGACVVTTSKVFASEFKG